MDERKDSRSKDYKKGIDFNEGRRRRDEPRIQLRKNKRDERLQKRRTMGTSNTISTLEGGEVNSTTAFQTAMPAIGSTNIGNMPATKTAIPELMLVLRNGNSSSDQVDSAIRSFRKMLSVEKNPPVCEVIDAGALPIFVQLLGRSDAEKIQFEAAWALTNVASTEYTNAVVQCGAVPHLVKLLQSPNPDCREQSAWCLGNVAGDSPVNRDYVLQCGALAPLLQNIAQPANPGLLGNVVWALSNFCRGKPQPSLEAVGQAIPYLANLLKGDNKEALMDACWALSYLSDGDNNRIEAVMSSGITSEITKLLDSSNSASVITPALRILGNFVSGNDTQTQTVLDAGILNLTGSLLTHARKNVRKETCWLLSNIAAGTHSQIGALMRVPNDLYTVVEAVKHSEWEVKKEATWVISNIATGGTDEHVQAIVELGAIDAVCSVLEVSDSKITLVALDAIENILKVGIRAGKDYIALVDECDGLDKIESLQEHEEDEVYEKAVKIIEEYFGVEIEDENLMPSGDGDHFAFGLQQGKNLDLDFSEGAEPQHSTQQPLQQFNF